MDHTTLDDSRRPAWQPLQLAAVLWCLIGVTAFVGPAAAQSISGASASTSGSTGNSGNGDGSIRSSTHVQINDGTTLKTRYAWNLSADVGVASTRDSNGTARHFVDFDVTAPGGYRLDITQQRVGIIQRNSDVSGCDGAADISAVTGSFTGGSLSGTLTLSDPGSIGNGGGDANTPFNQTNSSAEISATSNGGVVGHSLAFTWTGTTRSNSCEAAVRLGEGSSVSGCDACIYPGTPSRTQSGDGHFVTVTLINLCGNGAIDGGEDCDTALAGSCCNTNCQFRSSSSVCRASAGVCDNPENCTGSSAICPPNGFQSSASVCRPTAGVCDIAENCPGSGANCPADAFLGTATVCRPSAGVCDVAENCTGTIPVCPANQFASTATVCRPAADVCDLAENCTSTGPNCPANQFASSATVCRASGGPCDITENCTGSGASCPGDGKSSAPCRNATDVCDTAESCDGVNDDCPPDVVEPSSTVCRGAAGVCDVAEQCDGSTTACPADAKSTAECRATAGDCDVAESCDGAGDDCPADQFQPATLECRATAGDCDVAESCTGSDETCPADAFKPSSEECRADAGQCDVVENCPGTGADCPGDAFESDGASCDDTNACTLSDMCITGECIGDSMLCGDGVLQGGCGEECDDSNVLAGDGCSPSCLAEPGLGCPATPQSGCRLPFVPGKASLQMQKKAPGKDLLKWKWLKGDRTTLLDYGDPVNTTSYQVCLYDQSGLRLEITNPAGGVCAGKPCWTQKGFKGFGYKDKEHTPDGGEKLLLKEGAIGKAKILFTARAPGLTLPDLSTLVQPVTVQIENSDGLCWGAVYSSPPNTQSATIFKDKAD